ncbi:MAG TPA: tetratricopeptide repeat protein, partial [Aquabacterium sp.]|nr:tetratricopeptide repeat protein [Aquabacterium sp.]
SPRLQVQAVDNYIQAGLADEAVDAKKEYVRLFGRDSGLHVSRPRDWRAAQPKVLEYLKDLARYYHAKAQSTKRQSDYQEAVSWYRELLSTFSNDPDTVQNNFLLADLLYEAGLYGEAAVEYERVAYEYPWHAKAAEAGYAALQCHAQMRKGADALDVTRLQRASVTSALRFVKAFPGNDRTAAILTDTAEQLYALKDPEQANLVAMKIIKLNPPATDVQRRIAWNIMAQTASDRRAFGAATQAFSKVIELTSPQDPAYPGLQESLVSMSYKFGEQERTAGHLKEAAAQFKRVSETASQPTVRANAQFDAGSAQFDMKDWAGAQATLEDFRRRYPKHPLQGEVASKLAVAYSEQGKWSQAASEMERILAAGSVKDPALARKMLWQVADYHEKAGEKAAAGKAYERYLAQSLALRPVPLESTIETRVRLAQLAKDAGNVAREQSLMKEIYEADLHGGDARTDRTRYLGAKAALRLAEPMVQAYRKVALVEPLQKQLKLKKAKLEEALQAFALASEPGVAEVSTEVTYQVASLYRDFGKAILGSQRPKKLSDVELEQYNVLLEEQALPFEEKASDMHEVNARRAAQGIYDEWVQRSFDALAELLPVRYGKRERGEGVNLASVPAAQLAQATPALEQAASRSTTPAVAYNQLGVHYRQLGQFDKARSAYEHALAADQGYAPAALNLGILSDLYLGDSDRALTMYQRYLELTPQGDPVVTKWIAELKRRQSNSTAHKEAS